MKIRSVLHILLILFSNPFMKLATTDSLNEGEESVSPFISTNPLMPFSQPSATAATPKPQNTKPGFGKGGFNPLGNVLGFGKKKPNPFLPFGSLIELGGSLGPVVTANSTNNATSTVALPPMVNYTQNITGVVPPVMPSAVAANESTNQEDDDSGLLSFLDNFSPLDSIKNLISPNLSSDGNNTSIIDSLKNLLFPSPSSPAESATPEDYEEEPEALSLLQNFAPSMAGNASNFTVPMNLSSFGSSGKGSKVSPLFQQLLRNFTLPFISGGVLGNSFLPFPVANKSPLNFTITPIMNATISNFTNQFLSGSVTPLNSLLNSLVNNSATTFNFTNPFAPSNGTSPSFNDFLNSLLNTTSTKFNFVNPFATVPMASGPSALNNMLPFLPPSLFGLSGDEDYYEDPEEFEDLYESGPEKYENPEYLSGIDLPSFFGSMPSMFGNLNLPSGLAQSRFNLPSMIKNLLNMGLFSNSGNGTMQLNNIMSMVQKLLTPTQNGSSPFVNLAFSTFGPNGTMSFGTSPLLTSGLFNSLNLSSMMNPNSTFNMSSLANYQPLSSLSNVISILNSTGMFGDMSGISSLIQNITSLISQAQTQTGNNKTAFLDQAINDINSIWKDMNTTMQTFVKNMVSMPSTNNSIPTPFPSHFPIPFPPRKPAQLPSKQPPMNFGAGSSFLALPASGIETQSEAPEVSEMQGDEPQPEQTNPPPTNVSSSTDKNDDGIVDYVGAPIPNPTNTLSSAAPSLSDTEPASGSSAGFTIGSISPTWISMIGFLVMALNQQMFA